VAERPGGSGNQGTITTDLTIMGCDTWREHLSADLDGEADPELLPRAHEHLAGCPDCTRWFADATLVNRLIRTGRADPAPGLTEAQLAGALAELPRPASPRRRVWHLLARVALACAGVSQAALGVVALIMPEMGADPRTEMMGADLAHMSHESAAWNVALGVAFLAGAVWTRHLAGTLPVLGSFILVLSLVSAMDLLGGNVNAARVGSHALVLLGLGLIVLILATRRDEYAPKPSGARIEASVPFASGATAADAPQRPATAPTRPDPAARHRAA